MSDIDTNKDKDKDKKNPLLTLLIITNTVFVIFILFKQVSISDRVEKVTSPDSATSFSSKPELPFLPKAKKGSIIKKYSFGAFTANLARESGPQRYITIEVTLYIETLSSAQLQLLEIENRKSVLRDDVISILNSMTPQDILKLEGRSLLKNLIKDHLNTQLKSDHVKELLFTKFLVS